MNLIVLCADTYRVDYLSCYNADSPVATPNLERLAAEGLRFSSAFGEGTPTLPARRVLYTGRPIFPFLWAPQKWDRVQLAGWHPMFYEDVTLAEHLMEQGYTTGLISDLPHQFKPGKNFHRGFLQFEWVRGQEMDYYRAGPKAQVPVEKFMHPDTPGVAPVTEQFLLNAMDWKSEEDWCSVRVLKKGMEFLRNCAQQQPFMLWMEAFSPHEPWFAPPEVVEKYDHSGYDGPEMIFPPGSDKLMTPAQCARVKAHYAGLCELIDRWFGRLLETADALGLLDDTVVVFLSDHGTMLGEQGQYHKGPDRLRWQCTQVPLLLKAPGVEAGGVRNDFCQHPDLMPTVLKLLGQPVPERCLGRDLLAGPAGAPDHVVTSFGWFASVRDREWSYQTPWVDPNFGPIPERQRQLTPPQLYDLTNDPDELTNVVAEHPDIAARFQQRLLDYIRRNKPLTKGSLDVSEAVFDDVPLFDQSRL